ncbi:MAG: metallophosphoesterase family protein [Candidatus Lokiarchaeota archaeon]|nr:metallophosphoesterase family protein [Candidatus Lokiarchaeota archaeon]
MIWFTADFHLSHANIINYCNRPFKDVRTMDEKILDNLEHKLNPGDTLYFLGDLTFKESTATAFFERFSQCDIHYIVGNHDSKQVIELAKEYCKSVNQVKDIKLKNQNITLCHYAMRVWNKSHFNSWQLYGHSHGRLEPIGKQHDVGVDNCNFSPISFRELLDLMEKKPDNFNYIKPENRT